LAPEIDAGKTTLDFNVFRGFEDWTRSIRNTIQEPNARQPMKICQVVTLPRVAIGLAVDSVSCYDPTPASVRLSSERQKEHSDRE